MEEQDIICCKCGKFILTEQRDKENKIHCINGSYENGFYDELEDEFYCLECAKQLGKNK